MDFYPSIAKICVVRDREFKVKRTKTVYVSRSLCDLVISRIFDGVSSDDFCRGESLDIAKFAAGKASNVALDRDLFLRLINLAVVKNEPTKLVIRLFSVPVPAILPIIIGIFRKKRDILSAACRGMARDYRGSDLMRPTRWISMASAPRWQWPLE